MRKLQKATEQRGDLCTKEGKQERTHACMHVRACFSDDNRNEHEGTRSGTRMRIPVSDAKVAEGNGAARGLMHERGKQERTHACMHVRTGSGDGNRASVK